MKYVIITLTLLILTLVSTILLGCSSGEETTAAEQVVMVQRGNLTTQITGVGNLSFSQTVDVPFEIDGTVSEILVAEGDSVTEGEVLSRLDTTAWQDEINTLTSQATTTLRNLTSKQRAVTTADQNVSVAQQGVKTANNTIISKQLSVLQAQINLQNAQLALEEAEETTTDEVQLEIKLLQVELAEGQYNTALTELNNARTFGIQNALAAVDEAEAKLVDAQLAVGDAQVALDDANQALEDAKSASPEVKAPFDGLITKVNVAGGDEIKKGTVAVTIADPNKFEASVMVSELNILKIQIGGTATVSVEALSSVSIPATVSFIAPSATISSSVVNYEVKVQLAELSSLTTNPPAISNNVTTNSGNFTRGGSFGDSGPSFSGGNFTQEQITQFQQRQQSMQTALSSLKLVQGLTVTVSIITAQAIDVLLVPTQAIVTSGGKTTVSVMVNGVAETRQVETGISNSSYTEITSGLNEGDQIVVPLTTSSTSSSSSQSFSPGGGGFFFGR
jgi:multidrug efflux pump subunit AcrA (membrane-fusion protein)